MPVPSELERAGMSFGMLIDRTGNAVAETQRKLTETGAATASALATTLVDVIAVRETVYDDQGIIDDTRTHTRTLPLITFVDPVFYEWSRVRLQGHFQAREFKFGTESTSRQASQGFGGGIGGPLLFLGVSGFYSGGDKTVTESAATRSTDLSLGQVRMSALLVPRRDVGVPKPRQVIQGPRLAIIPGAMAEVRDAAGVLTGRTLSLIIQYSKREGPPIAGKDIAIETEGVPWSFVAIPPAVDPTKTDAQGQIQIRLERQFLDPSGDTTPVDVVVTARKGLVTDSTTVTL